MAHALNERTSLATFAAEGRNVVADFTVRTVAANLIQHVAYDAKTLKSVLLNTTLAPHIRFDAAARLFAIADLHFDAASAQETYSYLPNTHCVDNACTPALVRAHLVYHTSFGDRARAERATQTLLNDFPDPSGDDEPRRSRSYVILALLRLGYYDRSAVVGEADWQYFTSLGNRWAAEYAGSLAVESYLNLGQFERARCLCSDMDEAFKSRPQAYDGRTPIHESVRIVLAMIEGDYAKAALMLSDGHIYREWSTLAPRTRAVALSYRVRLAQLRHAPPSSYASEQNELFEYFARGRRFAAQDSLAEAVWHAMRGNANESGATSMLRSYLRDRRELGAPEALFRASTSGDPAWKKCKSTRIETKQAGLGLTLAIPKTFRDR
jgi:hypothetical protein